MPITGVHHYSCVVADLDRTIRFYQRVLGMHLRARWHNEYEGLGRAVLGHVWDSHQGEVVLELALMELEGFYVEFVQWVRPPTLPRDIKPSGVGSAHMAFRVKNIERERKRIEEAGVEFHSGINSFSDLGGDPSLWKWCAFRDPDDNILELIEEWPVDVYLSLMADRIREVRHSRGLTLQEVASKGDFSAAHLSQIERGQAQPSVATLLSITQALGLPPEFFLRSIHVARDAVQTTAESSGQLAAGGGGPEAPESGRTGDRSTREESASRPTRPIERGLTLGSEVAWLQSATARGLNRFEDFYLAERSADEREPSGNGSEESGIVLEGTLLMKLDSTEHTLGPGSSITFRPTTRWRLVNIGAGPASGIWATRGD